MNRSIGSKLSITEAEIVSSAALTPSCSPPPLELFFLGFLQQKFGVSDIESCKLGNSLQQQFGCVPLPFKVMASRSSSSDENRYENIMFVSKGLVHSSQSNDVRRGIAMLEESIVTTASSLHQQKDKLYLIAFGYCKICEYSMSMHYLKRCLEIEPLWTEALTLKQRVGGLLGNGATATVRAIARAGACAAVCVVRAAAEAAIIATMVGLAAEVRRKRAGL
ncbi:Mitochondria fission 1 protein [Macleaya cordata]|uniref:Mitochondria fission 1 protein n=1 Tax=Macleaya cordata TaxID=56857 RepID=A0A200Q946_MACCD|nr:Mitochondria fission 1 protein [Macleaya cordata]